MAILNLLGAKAHLNASHAGAHYRCSPRTPFLANFGFADHRPRIVGILCNGLVLARTTI
jgi:hypothetical protein